MMIELVFLASLGFPIIMTLPMINRNWRPMSIRIAPFAAVPAILIVMLVAPGTTLEFPWALLGARLGIDSLSRVFLAFTAFLWFLSGLFARGYLASDNRQHRFFIFFLLAMSGNIGIVLAEDLISFLMFFSLLSFSSYGMIVHYGDSQALRAGRIYIYLVILGELLLYAGLSLAAINAASLEIKGLPQAIVASPMRDLIIGLLLAGFGIKAGIIPLHVWLPLAHPCAPTPASAVLSGALIKAGLLGWLRFLPLGLVVMSDWGILFIVLGLVSAVYGVLVGLTQSDPKTILAYSSISQMGLMTVGLGLSLVSPEVGPEVKLAVALFALHHALAKASLFLSVGILSANVGATWERIVVKAALLFNALVLAGAPLTSGALAKSALVAAISPASLWWIDIIVIMLSLAGIGTALLMTRFVYLAWSLKPQGSSTASHVAKGVWVAWAGSLTASALAVWMGPQFVDADVTVISPSKLWNSTWPIALAVVFAWIGPSVLGKLKVKPHVSVPAGDIVVLTELLSQRYLISIFKPLNSDLARLSSGLREWLHTVPSIAASQHLPDSRIEQSLGRWLTAGVLFLVCILAMFVALALVPHFLYG